MKKPNREPDFISKIGTYLWFDELVLLSLSGDLIPMFFDEGSSSLRVKPFISKCGDCWRCKNGHDCERCLLSRDIQEAYRKWDADAFEKTLGLGAENE